jgi:hypothetical protein
MLDTPAIIADKQVRDLDNGLERRLIHLFDPARRPLL